MRQGTRSLIVAGAVLAILLVAAGIVVATAPQADPLDPSSPEGVVQTYVSALLEGDEERAAELLSTQDDDDCFSQPPPEESIRITLASSEVDGDRAVVEVLVTHSGGEPPFDRYEYSEDATFELEQTDSGWLITEVPWQFQVCPKEER